MPMQQRTQYELRLFLMKLTLMALAFVTFFLLLSIHNPQILRLSRTAGVTMLTFAVLLPIFAHQYHGFDVRRQDARHTTGTSMAAVCLTDLITYFQLLIMNFNEDNRSSLTPVAGEVGCLALAMLVQLGLIILYTALALQLHRHYNPPLSSVLICTNDGDARFLRGILAHYPQRYRIDRVLCYPKDDVCTEILRYRQVFLYNIPHEARQSLVEYCYKLAMPVSYNMEITDIIGYGAGHDMFADISFLSANNRRELTLEQRILKRALDVAGASLLTILFSPVMAACALAIWLHDRQCVIFRQHRTTLGGRVFTIYKFRTMRPDADPARSALSDDDRITPVGRVLRRFRLDELPQLFNILKGDMSLVGPRPEMLANVERYTGEMPEFSYRLAVKAGLTGYAQIAGKYNTAPKEKMILDLMYIEDYSIWRDIKLLIQTIGVLFRRESSEGFSKDSPAPAAEEKKVS